MDLENQLELITRFPATDILTVEDLRARLEMGHTLKHYIGFEISGHPHLGQGLGCMSKLVDFQKAGVETSLFLADWHTWINNKLGGDWDAIQNASHYFESILKIGVKLLGGDPEKVKVVRGSDLYHNNDEYWKSLVEISKHVTIKRAMKSVSIMGREEGQGLDLAKLMYAPMQAADVFEQDLDIAHAGIDQRKVHVIVRDVGDRLRVRPLIRNGEVVKPIAIHHELWLGLNKPQTWPIPEGISRQDLFSEMKMSKSIAGTAVFMSDSEQDIRKKLKKAFCPEKVTDFNPVMNWAKHLVFRTNDVFVINRKPKFGGDLQYETFSKLEQDFVSGEIHPLDLKNAMADLLVDLLRPARELVEKNPDLIEPIKKAGITR